MPGREELSAGGSRLPLSLVLELVLPLVRPGSPSCRRSAGRDRRGPVWLRARRLAAPAVAGRGFAAGQAEVHDADVTITAHHRVLGLEVTVDQPPPVSGGESRAQRSSTVDDVASTGESRLAARS